MFFSVLDCFVRNSYGMFCPIVPFSKERLCAVSILIHNQQWLFYSSHCTIKTAPKLNYLPRRKDPTKMALFYHKVLWTSFFLLTKSTRPNRAGLFSHKSHKFLLYYSSVWVLIEIGENYHFYVGS